jgi:hypothetical protein
MAACQKIRPNLREIGLTTPVRLRIPFAAASQSFATRPGRPGETQAAEAICCKRTKPCTLAASTRTTKARLLSGLKSGVFGAEEVL